MPFWLPSTWNMICRTCSTDMWAIANDEPSVMALKGQLAECQAKGHQASSIYFC